MKIAARAGMGRGAADHRPKRWILIALGAFALAGAAGVIVLRLDSDRAGPDPGLQIGLLVWIILTYTFSGLIAWRRRPDTRLGPLMVAAGYFTLLACTSSSNSVLVFTVGQAFDLIPFALFLHVFLAFPTGYLHSRAERVLVVAAYVTAVGLEVIGLMLGGFNPDNVIAVASEPEFATQLFEAQLAVLAAISLTGIVLLFARRRTEGPPLRRSLSILVNSFALALLAIAALLTMASLSLESPLFLPIQRTAFFLIGLAPIVFLIALLDARLARASIGDLLVALRAEPAPTELREPLATALHDPSLELAYWLPQYGSWADQDGRRRELPAESEHRVATLIDRDGEHLAALIHDPSLSDEPELLDAVSAAAGIALENGRLHAELRAKLEELKGSRGRVIEAGQQERKRLERNLHDGAQQRLIALSLDLRMLGDQLPEDPEAQARIDAARSEIAVSLEELRDVARGLHPAVLSGHGLGVALESLAATSAVPVRLSVAVEGRLEEPIEVAAFYVVSETLANIGKHAEAESATVLVARENAGLVVEVVDDGIGGADSERGSGLRGLADRVEALGGSLRIWTPLGGGTRVRAEMPCA